MCYYIIHFSIKKHILSHHPKELLSLDEFIKVRTEVVKETLGSGQMNVDDTDAAPPGDEPPPGVETEGSKVDIR